MNLCDNQIPAVIYRVRRLIGKDKSELHVWIGSTMSDSITTFLKNRNGKPGNTTIRPTERSLFRNIPNSDDILGFNENIPVFYHQHLLESDDNLIQLKEAIFVYIGIPPEYQYLSGKIGDSRVIMGHNFFATKIKKSDRDVEVTFDRDPFGDHVDDASTAAFFEKLPVPRDTSGIILSEFSLEKDEITLIALTDFLKYKKWEISLDAAQAGTVHRFWPYRGKYPLNPDFLKDGVNMRLDYDDYDSLENRVKESEHIRDFLHGIEWNKGVGFKNGEKLEIQPSFEDCNLLELVIHVNYETAELNFIDLAKIYNMLPLTNEYPFVKFKDEHNKTIAGYKHKNAVTKLFRPAARSGDLPKKMVEEWMKNTQRIADVHSGKSGSVDKRFFLSGKGLSYKVRLNSWDGDDNIPRFATVSIFRDGKIEIKCSWPDSIRANMNDHVNDVIQRSHKLIKRINKIQYHMQSVDRRLRIDPPDLQMIEKLAGDFTGRSFQSNTNISLMNAAFHFKYPDLDLYSLLKQGQNFGTYVKIHMNGSYEILLSDANNHTHSIKLTLDERDNLGITPINKSTTSANVELMKIDSVPEHVHDVTVDIVNDQISVEVENNKGHTHEFVRFIDPFSNNMLQLRYRRVNNYDSMNNIFAVINNLVKQGGGQSEVIAALVETFPRVDKSALEENYKIYKSKFVTDEESENIKNTISGRIQAKDPGIDIRVRKDQESNRITILGCKNIYQLAQTYNFLRKLIYITVNDIEVTTNTKSVIDDRDDLGVAGEGVGISLEELLGDDEVTVDPDDENVREKKKRTQRIIGSNVKRKVYKSNLDMLKAYTTAGAHFDKKGPGLTYSRACQAGRHPIVMTNDEKDATLLGLSERLDNLKKKTDRSQTEQEELDEITGALQAYANGRVIPPIGDDLFFVCPAGYCPSCNSVLTLKSAIKGVCPFCKNTNIYKAQGRNNRIHLGFTGLNDEGRECLPCCFDRDQSQNQKQAAKFEQCLGVAPSKSDPKNTKINNYVLDKEILPHNRWGHLPKELRGLFNQHDNAVTGGDPKSHSGFLMRGVHSGSKGDKFLSVIAEIATPVQHHLNPRYESGDDVRKTLLEVLRGESGQSYFMSMRKGYIQLIFEELGDDPLDTFIKFMENSNNLVDEEYLWDLISIPGVIRSSGFNLFIIEKTSGKEGYVLKCPLGYDLDTLYDRKRPSTIALKNGDTYQPIFFTKNSMDLSSTVKMLDFKDHADLLGKLFDMVESCRPVSEKSLIAGLKQTMGDEYVPDSKEMNLKDSISHLHTFLNEHSNDGLELDEYSIEYHMVDSYKKVVSIVLKNGVAVPVKSSGVIPSQKTVDADDYRPADYATTFKTLQTIALATAIPCHPAKNLVLNDDRETVVGLALETGRVVETIVEPLESVRNFQFHDQNLNIKANAGELPVEIIMNLPSYVDRAILSDDQYMDEMHKKVGRRLYEDESLDRFRLEVSKYLQNNPELHENILSIILSRSKLKDRRDALSELVDDMYDEIVVSFPEKNDEFFLNYRVPPIRKSCFQKGGKIKKNDDPHCLVVGNQRKLYIPKTGENGKNMRETFVALLTEDLLRNEFKRNEILLDQLDVYVDPSVIIRREEEAIFNLDDLNLENPIKKRGENVFQQSINDIYDDRTDHGQKINSFYDIANPSGRVGRLNVGNGDLCEYVRMPMNKHWSVNVLNPSFRVMHHSGNYSCSYDSLATALNQLGGQPLDMTTLRLKLTRFVDEELGDGWEQYLKHLKVKYPNIYKNVNDSNDLLEMMSGHLHPLTLIELSWISRIYGVKFIILNSQILNQNPSGLTALKTTQTLKDKFIILYHHSRDKYEVIVNASSGSKSQMIFEKSEIPEKLIKLWEDNVGDTDNKSEIDNANELIKENPVKFSINIRPRVKSPIETREKTVAPPAASSTVQDDMTPDRLPTIPGLKKVIIHVKPKPPTTLVSPLASPDAMPAITPRENKDSGRVVKVNIKARHPLPISSHHYNGTNQTIAAPRVPLSNYDNNAKPNVSSPHQQTSAPQKTPKVSVVPRPSRITIAPPKVPVASGPPKITIAPPKVPVASGPSKITIAPPKVPVASGPPKITIAPRPKVTVPLKKKSELTVSDRIKPSIPMRIEYKPLIKMEEINFESAGKWIRSPDVRANLVTSTAEFLGMNARYSTQTIYDSPHKDTYQDYIINEILPKFKTLPKNEGDINTLKMLVSAAIGLLSAGKYDHHYIMKSLHPGSNIEKVDDAGNCYFESIGKHVNLPADQVRKTLANTYDQLDEGDKTNLVAEAVSMCPGSEFDRSFSDDLPGTVKNFSQRLLRMCEIGNIDCEQCLWGGSYLNSLVVESFNTPLVEINMLLTRDDQNIELENYNDSPVVKDLLKKLYNDDDDNDDESVTISTYNITLVYQQQPLPNQPMESVEKHTGSVISYVLYGSHIEPIFLA